MKPDLQFSVQVVASLSALLPLLYTLDQANTNLPLRRPIERLSAELRQPTTLLLLALGTAFGASGSLRASVTACVIAAAVLSMYQASLDDNEDEAGTP